MSTDTLLKRLQMKRSTVRDVITELISGMEVDFEGDGADEFTLEESLAQLRRKEQDLIKLDDEIEDLVDLASLEEELLSVEKYREKITLWVTRLQLKIRQASDSESTTSSRRSSGNGSIPTVKLPRLSLGTFYGDSSNWQNFWAQFSVAIHDNKSLNNVDKFNYLKSFLGGAAASSIAGISLTEPNYEKAIQILQDRFGRRDLIISSHMNNLLTMEPVRRSTDIEALRKLYDACEIQVKSLESLGVVSETYGSLLCPILLKMIPVDIALDFTKRRVEDSDWDVMELLSLLRKEVESRERTKFLTKSLNDFSISKGNTNKMEGHDTGKQWKGQQVKQPSASALNNTTTTELNCIYCDSKEHSKSNCESLTVEEKRNLVKRQGRCFVCLKKYHVAKTCRSKGRCINCNGRHHKTLCEGLKLKQPEPTSTALTSLSNNLPKFSMYLQTAQALAKGESETVVRCLLDSGSQRSFIREDISRKLKLPVVGVETLNIHAFGEAAPVKVSRRRVKVTLQNMKNPHQLVEMEVLESPEICSGLIQIPSKEIQLKLSELGLNLADDPENNTTGPTLLNVIIGADYYWTVVSGKTERLSQSLVAVETLFGWSIHGPASMSASTNVCCTATNVFKIFSETEEELASTQLRKFWELDALGITENIKSDIESENLATLLFQSTVQYDQGKYTVKLPWKPEMKEKLCNNRTEAENRLNGLLKRLRKDPVLLTQYNDVLKEYVAGGIIEEVETTDESKLRIEGNGSLYYLPHRAVIKQERCTTKVRIVFDASCKSKGGFSLNDCLYSGPNLNPNLFELLIRFRENRVAFTADIEKAFLQIGLAKEDRDVARFLWIDEPFETNGEQKLKLFRFTRVLFGVTSSPFLLAATLKHHLGKYSTIFPETCELLGVSLYVDDLIGGADNEENALQRSNETKTIMQNAGMFMRKWRTNSNELRQMWQDMEPETHMSVNFAEEQISQLKVLGITWDPQNDVFYFECSLLLSYMINRKNTKRFILQAAGRVFDPVGFLTPFTIRIKCLFQQLWTKGIGWDCLLPKDVLEEWEQWCIKLKDLSKISLPRYYFSSVRTDQNVLLQLHCFTDANPRAYGAVLYLRASTSEGNIHTTFICSKSRVAPLKTLTVPRLELMGALIGAKISKKVASCLRNKVTCHFWTDSTIVFYWIRSSSRQYKPFVENRINEIQNLTEPVAWSHCPGKENPADILTRGQSLAELKDNRMWWHGPSWLCKTEEFWPKAPTETEKVAKTSETEMRAKCQSVLQTVLDKNPSRNSMIDIQRYSSFNRLVRVTAWIKRFVWNTRNPNAKRYGFITTEEISSAELYWIKETQRQYFSTEISSLQKQQEVSAGSKLHCMAPFLDEYQIVRLGGRIQKSELSFEQKHPVILPRDAKLTELLIEAYHKKAMHAGVADTLSRIRQKFWIMKGRQITKKVIYRCLTCKKFKAKPVETPVAPLPKERIRESPPFAVAGVDFAGPLYTRAKKTTSKAYIALFTCAVTRAVHLELVSDLSTDKFILALKRFFARRGVCATLFSDNAKTFKKAEKELKQKWAITREEEVQNYLGNQRITWKFIVELSPWWGGFFERLVRSVKTILRKVLGNACLTFEELTTLLIEVEAIINTRPMTFTYNESNEPIPLTPAHFLSASNLQMTAPSDPYIFLDTSTKTELTKRIRYRKTILKRIWNRWSNQYLLDLRSAHLGQKKVTKSTLKEGDVVLIEENKKSRALWNMGIITKVFPGRDGEIRSCELKTSKGTFIRRSVQLLYPLEL